MDEGGTIAVLVAAALAFAWANWRARKPTEMGQSPFVPYLLVQFIAIIIALLVLAHLITLTTGVPFTGRGR